MNEELKDDLIVGVIWGLIGGLTWGLTCGLIGGLIWGLTCGLTITFTTQLIALITSNPNFVMFDLIISGIILVIMVTLLFSILFIELHKVKIKIKKKTK